MHTGLATQHLFNCFMRRSKRVSSINSSLKLDRKLALRETRARNKKFQKQLPNKETIELSSSIEVDTSAKDTSEEDAVFTEEEEYWIDSSAYKFTDPELVRSNSPFIQPPTDSSRWSTSVNHLGLDNTIVEV